MNNQSDYLQFPQRLAKTNLVRFLFLALFVAIGASSSFAQSNGAIEISPSAITGGGNTTSNGAQSITGSIGQSPMGTAANGPFIVTGGFFSIHAIAFKFGDTNSDQTVTITDLVQVANFIAGNIPSNSPVFNRAAADVNQDGVIDIKDLVIIANFLAGNIGSLPVAHQ